MTASNFPASLAAFWTFDGLKDDHAQGEKFATSYGVTIFTWRAAQQEGLVTGSIDHATKTQCETILHGLYWVKCRCDDLPAGIDLMVFNDATLSGVGHTIPLLQRLVGVDDDGVIGPVTLKAVAAVEATLLIKRIHDADERYLASLATAPLYLKGWKRREDYMQTAALKMAVKGATA